MEYKTSVSFLNSTHNNLEKNLLRQVQNSLLEVNCVEDFALFLNASYTIYTNKKCDYATKDLLLIFSQRKESNKRYNHFILKKKSGDDRIIHAPILKFKKLLQILNIVLQNLLNPHNAATGFVTTKSIVDNAKEHICKNYVYNIDLKDFFFSFDYNRVKYGLLREFWTIKNDIKSMESDIEYYIKLEKIAKLIASLCTHRIEINGEIKYILPQGSPTSPTLTNILCKKLDHRLNGLAKRFGATYTRYADDITFSSNRNIYKNDDFQSELNRIIEDNQKFKINVRKTRLQKSGYRQEATGLVINQKVNISRNYIKQIRMWLYYWEKYGYGKAVEIFMLKYLEKEGLKKIKGFSFVNILRGKLNFVKMVKGADDSTYIKLMSRYSKLISKLPLD